jgi:hypothetical protein
MLFHFYYDPNSLKGNPFGFVDKWIIFQHGEPFLMAQRSTLPLDEVATCFCPDGKSVKGIWEMLPIPSLMSPKPNVLDLL